MDADDPLRTLVLTGSFIKFPGTLLHGLSYDKHGDVIRSPGSCFCLHEATRGECKKTGSTGNALVRYLSLSKQYLFRPIFLFYYFTHSLKMTPLCDTFSVQHSLQFQRQTHRTTHSTWSTI